MNAIKKALSWVHLHLVILWAITKHTVDVNAKLLWSGIEKVLFVVLLFFHKVFATLPVRAWRGFKIFAGRVGFQIYIRSRYYKNWSHLYQWLYERKYKSVSIDKYATLADLQKVIATCTWVADGLKELGDAFSSAGYIQHVINGGGTRSIGDCDEFAMYNSTAIRDSIDAGAWKDRAIKDTQIMTVTWMNKDRSWDGHNVCVILWADGKMSYVDYYAPSNECADYETLAGIVISNYGGVENLGFQICDRNLDVLKVYWK